MRVLSVMMAGASSLGLTLAATAARAQEIPRGCSASRDATSYRTGLASGKALVQRAWASVNNCDQIDNFANIIVRNVDNVQAPASSTSFLLCRYAGTIDGVFDGLANQFGICEDQCFDDGTVAGQITAIAYCELSIALGGLGLADDFIRGPVQTCGFGFEVGCDSAFVGTSVSYSNTLGQCLQYTKDEYFPVWDQTRNNQCAYDPILDPILFSSEEDED